MNKINKGNIRASNNLRQFQEVNGIKFNTPQSFQNMMGRSCIPTHLSQNIQNAQLHKQEDENSGSQNK